MADDDPTRRDDDDRPIELETPDPGSRATAAPDPRPRIAEPIPVKLVAVADVRLPMSAGLEREMDRFYVGLLRFERKGAEPRRPDRIDPARRPPDRPTTAPPVALGLRGREEPRPARVPDPPEPMSDDPTAGPVYLAENFRVRFHVVEGLVERDAYRPLGVEVPSLAEAEAALIEAEVEHVRQKGVALGQESIVLQDPAGNWVELVEARPVT